MITCPVCEHPQAHGTECDVCGRPFPPDLVQSAGHVDPPPEPVPGLELTAVVSPEATPATPAVAANAPCVWCGHVQAEGRICDRCGMQRHRGERLGATAAPFAEEARVCPECGAPESGSRCRNCGARMPEAE